MEKFNIIPIEGKWTSIAAHLNENFSLAAAKLAEIAMATSKSKGLFDSVSSLNLSYPNPQVGDWALVGNGLPARVYLCVSRGTWVDSGTQSGGEPINLNDYAKTADVENLGLKVSEIEQKTSEITSTNEESDTDSIEIYQDDTLIHHINDKEADFKNLKSNGMSVLTNEDGKQFAKKTDLDSLQTKEIEYEISVLEITSDDDKDVYTSIGGRTIDSSDEDECIEFRSEDEKELYSSIGRHGVVTNRIVDTDGNILFCKEHDEISEDVDVSVNYANPFAISELISSSNHIPEKSVYINKSYFSAPKGVGKCKLVIICGGGGARAKEDAFSYMNIGRILNSIGYAVLCVTGWSREWAHENGMYAWGDQEDDGRFYYIKDGQKIYLSDNVAPIGNWTCIEEAKKAYDYVINKYHWIDRGGVFLYGESQGGMVIENIAELSGIPIRATILDVPAISMQYAQMYIPSRKKAIKTFYGLENHVFEKSKCIGCDPFTRGMSEDIVMNEDGNLPFADIGLVKAKKQRGCSTPLLILTGLLDTTISTYVHQCYAKALINNGFPVEVKKYNVGHGVVQYTDVIGKISGYDVRAGLSYVLSFMQRYGGYDYNIV